MSNSIRLYVNGREIIVRPGTVVAAAIAQAGANHFRSSLLGELRGPLCGMGICMECRVTIDGEVLRRSCQVLCAAGMEVQTGVC